MIRRQIAGLFICLALVVVATSPASAALQAAPELIPADVAAAFSIGDAPSMWTQLKSSPLYASLKKFLELPAVQSNSGFQSFLTSMKDAESRLGFSLQPDSLFGTVLTGMDIAIAVEAGMTQEPAALVVLKFKDPKNAAKLLQVIEEEAKKMSATPTTAPGTTTAAPAIQPVTRQTIAGQEVLVVPAEGLWATQKNDLLVMASSAELMGKSLTAASNSLDKAPAVRSALTTLGNPSTSHCFFYIDNQVFAAAMAESNPMLQGMSDSAKTVGVAFAAPDHMRVQMVKKAEKADAYVVQSATQFPAGDIRINSMIPSSSLFNFSLNFFDSASILSYAVQVLAEAQATEPSAIQAQLDSMLLQTEAMLGFKIREDLLAALGPEFAMNLDNFAFNAMMGAPTVDLAILAQVKDKAKLDLVLQKLETYINTQIAAMMGGAQPGTQQAQPAITMRALDLGNAKGKILDIPNMPGIGIGWVIVGDYVVFGSSETALKNAAQTASGQLKSLKSDPALAKASQYLLPKAHSQVGVGLASATTIVTNILMMVTPQVFQGEDGQVALAFIDVLKTIDKAYMNSAFTPQGDTLSAGVLLFGQPSATQPATGSTN